MTDGFWRHGLPLGVLQFDNWHWRDYRIFNLDARRLSGMTSLMRNIHERGVHVVTILQGCVKRDDAYDIFADGKRKGVFCKRPDGRTVFAPSCAGWTAYPDFTDLGVRFWWKPHYGRLLEAGFDGFWHDMNEPAAFAAWGDFTLPRSTHGTPWMAAAATTARRTTSSGCSGRLRGAARSAARTPAVVALPLWLGGHTTLRVELDRRYRELVEYTSPDHWYGRRPRDVAVPYSGSDIGGFSGAPSTELYLRWFQMSAFLPFFCTHSSFYLPRREPWEFGDEALGIIRRYLELRYRLLPYLYTLTWEASQTGAPLARPLFWNEPETLALWQIEDAFMLGGDFVVALIVEEGTRQRTLQLPRGGWYSLSNDAYFDRSRQATFDAPLEHIPILVRAGAVLPMEKEERLQLHLYRPPDGKAGSG